VWIPSHIGISDNELADELAAKAIKSPNCQQYPYINYEDMTQVLRTNCNSLMAIPFEETNKL